MVQRSVAPHLVLLHLKRDGSVADLLLDEAAVFLSECQRDIEAERVDAVHALRVAQPALEPHHCHDDHDDTAAGTVDMQPPLGNAGLRLDSREGTLQGPLRGAADLRTTWRGHGEGRSSP